MCGIIFSYANAAMESMICGALPVVAFDARYLDVLVTAVTMVLSTRLVVCVDLAQLVVDTQISKFYC